MADSRTLGEILRDALKDPAVPLQVLTDCTLNVRAHKKPRPHTRVTFATDQLSVAAAATGEGPVGIVVWVPLSVYRGETR